MPYYLAPSAPLRGMTGTPDRWPVGADWGVDGNWIWLEKGPDGLALLWLATPDPDPALKKLADDADEVLTGPVRTSLSDLIGDRVVLPGARLRQVVTNMLRVPPISGRWKGLRPSRQRQRYEIWFGPGGRGKNLWFEEPTIVGPASKSIEDNFNRANGNLDASTSSDGQFVWDEQNGTEWEILSNQAQGVNIPDGDFSRALADFSLDTDDEFVEADYSIFTINAGTLLLYLFLRLDTLGAGPTSGYHMQVGESPPGTPGHAIKDWPTFEILATDASAGHTTGVLRFTMDGTTLEGFTDGVSFIGPVTDGTPYTGSRKTGIGMFASSSSTNDVGIGGFRSGDLVQVLPDLIMLPMQPAGLRA